MRTLTLSIFLAAAGTAHADSRIVVMTDDADAKALQLALAGRGVEVVSHPEPDGDLRLDRAAAAQHFAADHHATAAIWIERDPGRADVCVVSADGRVLRAAPMPFEPDVERIFAAIAVSLLDELVAGPPDIHVQVDVAPVAVPIAAVIGAPVAAPAVIERVTPTTARHRLIMIGVGGFVGTRGMNFAYDPNASSPPPAYPTSGYKGLQLAGAFYPWPQTDDGRATGLGVSYAVSKSVGSYLTGMDNTGYGDYALEATSWDATLHYRHPIGLVTIDGSLGLGNDAIRIIDLPESIEIPDTSYTYGAAGLHVDLDVDHGATVGAGARYEHLFSEGDVMNQDWYGGGLAYAYAVDASVMIPLPRSLYAQAALTFRRNHIDFEGDGAVTMAHGVWSVDDDSVIATATVGARL